MAPQLTPTKKARIWQYHLEGKKNREIAREMNRDHTTIDHLIRQMKLNPDPYFRTSGHGPPRKLSDRDLRLARREIDTGGCADGAEVKRKFFPEVGDSTVRAALAGMGLNGRVRRKKPLFRDVHVAKRRIFADQYRSWDLTQVKTLWFSNESKFNLIGSDGKRYCRRRVGEEFLPRNVMKVVKHGGGSVMVWGVISWSGTGELYRIVGNLNSPGYVRILDTALMRSLDDAGVEVEDMTFVQDNAPIHTSRVASAWFTDNGMKKLDWPPSSPDMNIIEHAWAILDHQLRKRNPLPTNLNQLWQFLAEEWEALDINEIRNLYRSVPRRIEALYKAKGSYTRY